VTLTLNPTQGSLLGFLHDGPLTGWDLLQRVDAGLSRFWNVTPSHVYRELRALESRRLIKAGPPGARDRRPFTITAAGRRAFKSWIAQAPGAEQMRIPLLVTLWFGRHVEPDVLAKFLAASRDEHARRLRYYRSVAKKIAADDPHTRAVVDFGIAYERAVIGWIDDLSRRWPCPPGDEK
jgi:DNA-binding PadR family transcriptional regulator